MSKKKNKSAQSTPTARAVTDRKSDKKTVAKQERDPDANAKWWREAIESVVVAIVLALLFRTFEAEAFVIPTGSMAPTLQGRHKDLKCSECGYRFRSGASKEQDMMSPFVLSTCPICRRVVELDPANNFSHEAYTGDRILVNKFAYQFADPERWDVIVFKFPGNAKQNYIKRLVGLPNEKLRISQGDVFVKPNGDSEFSIARKPPKKLIAMLQLVHDTKYQAESLIKAGWPARWRNDDSGDSQPTAWKMSDDHRTYTLSGSGGSDRPAWLRYRHIVPHDGDWDEILRGEPLSRASELQGELVTDFYAYNASIQSGLLMQPYLTSTPGPHIAARTYGLHWVGDLAFEADLRVKGSSGTVHLDIVEGGRHHQCQIDVSTGQATLEMDNGAASFTSTEGNDPPNRLLGSTKIQGAGKYRIRFSNADDQLLLWVNNRVVKFHVDGANGQEHDGTFESRGMIRPQWSVGEPGDLAPLGIAGQGVDLEISRLRVLRDVYYIAARYASGHPFTTEYDVNEIYSDTRWFHDRSDVVSRIRHTFTHPETWESSPIFEARRSEEFTLGEDQFFPMGDNSPQSKDARLWHQTGPVLTVEPSVDRKLLTGKAFMIYWPHPWYYIIPNVTRMGRIR